MPGATLKSLLLAASCRLLLNMSTSMLNAQHVNIHVIFTA
jgi:hypothetical protein